MRFGLPILHVVAQWKKPTLNLGGSPLGGGERREGRKSRHFTLPVVTARKEKGEHVSATSPRILLK